MTTADQVLTVARSQIGITEAPDGSNRFGQYYGMDKVAWCAQFIYYCLKHTDYDTNLIPKTAYTPALADWYRAKGWFGNTPKPGAIVFYNWPDSVNRIQHVGLVESVPAAGQIITIEGNTVAPSGSGDQSHGGGVWRRRRTTVSVVGYGYPAYTTEALVNQPWLNLPTLKQGDKGAAVAALQRFCNAYGWRPALPLLTVDGDYGAGTTKVIRAAQGQLGITGPDAVGTPFGPRTKQAFYTVGFRG
jgi:hypothetical protein